MSDSRNTQRVDLLLCRLRFAKTRGLAQRMVEARHIRCNGAHILRASHAIRPGDVLTFAAAGGVQIIEILRLPGRRGPAAEAQAHYRKLDRFGQTAIAHPESLGQPEEENT
ncbi:RNA-binding S4 domain-containing protein [Porphyrobacter sp. GA68]|uniref:RNA-binding S4 domain-containing protein n=1 Tax=Porphyrobacter sp. GA68 TaxID=2883480 RepID=UPI001D17FA8D|nr:S4 domain-containing protein [Porphyrobacter sp. GA68]